MVRRHIAELIASSATVAQTGYQLAGMATVHLEPALDEIERLNDENRQLREIVTELTGMSPLAESEDGTGWSWCVFCGRGSSGKVDHDDDCPWVRSVRLFERSGDADDGLPH